MSDQGGLLLLDTNVLILTLRAGRVGEFIKSRYGLLARAERPLISVVTVGETLAFAKKLGWGKPKVTALDKLLQELVHLDISHPKIVERYAELEHFSRSQKPAITMKHNDLWIAASAGISKARLVTTDRDFDHLVGAWLDRDYIDQATLAVSTS